MSEAQVVRRALQWLEVVLGVIAQHPWLLVPAAVVLLVGVVLASPAGGACEYRDPRRGFTVAERRAAFELAAHRCEHNSLFWHPCTNTPTQGDHIFPWSRGGRTTMSNQQALCPFHNSRKSGTVPTRLYILRLQWRRRRYFPDGVPSRVQWRPGSAL